MPEIPIETLDDPRLEPYRNLKDRELIRNGAKFIAEGENVVRRLIASRYKTESVLVTRRKRDEFLEIVPPDVPLFVAEDSLIREILGFKFHSGVIGCGSRSISFDLKSMAEPLDKPCRFVICQEITNSENLGALIRISAAFGATAMILGERCSDPFFRQSIRVSMGTIFSLPVVQSENLLIDLDRMTNDWGIDTVATVLSESATPLDRLQCSARMAIAFGSEAQGLDAATIAHCRQKSTIPMQLGTDSLNVAVAGALFLYELSKGMKRDG